MVKNYQKQFLDQHEKDQNSLFRKSFRLSKSGPKAFQPSEYHLPSVYSGWYDDSPKKNLRLYLPQIDNNEKYGPRANNTNSEDYSNK